MSDKKRLDSSGAHARFRKGGTDYGDAGHNTHYLGNDDYSGNEEEHPLTEEEKSFDGQVALGNGLSEDDVSEEENEDNSSQSDNLYDASI